MDDVTIVGMWLERFAIERCREDCGATIGADRRNPCENQRRSIPGVVGSELHWNALCCELLPGKGKREALGAWLQRDTLHELLLHSRLY